MQQRTLLSIPKACQVLGVCRRTLYNWMQSGKVEYVHLPGGSRRIYADTLTRTPEQYRDEQRAAVQWETVGR